MTLKTKKLAWIIREVSLSQGQISLTGKQRDRYSMLVKNRTKRLGCRPYNERRGI